MQRIFLRETNCIDCKHNVEDCVKHQSCYDCPISSGGCCLCLQGATDEELITHKCKYFTEKEKQNV